MKTKTYNTIEGLKFCPSCHRMIELPAFMAQVKCSENINLLCGSCQKGKIIIKEEKYDIQNN